jgi:mRNA-degrading endonuclease RelE of RelBE toxin-antitoxin system
VKTIIEWSPQARTDLRAIDRETAMRILDALAHYTKTGEGDVKFLTGPLFGKRRLRVGDWRVRFEPRDDRRIFVLRVQHRSEAYR